MNSGKFKKKNQQNQQKSKEESCEIEYLSTEEQSGKNKY